MDGLARERFTIFASQNGELKFFGVRLDPAHIEALLERTVKKKSLWRLIEELLPVGMKVQIPGGEKVDVLTLDAMHNCVGVLFELHSTKPITVTVGRAIIVASWLDGLSYSDVLRIARDWWGEQNADVASVHAQLFGGMEAKHLEGQKGLDGFNEHPRVVIVIANQENLSELQRYLIRQGISVEIERVEAFTGASGEAIICIERLRSLETKPRVITHPHGEVMGMVHSFLSALIEREE